MRDVLDYLPSADDYTADVLHEALTTLAWLRGLDPDPDPDPAIRLHLLASIQRQLRSDLLHATLVAHDHGYDHGQLDVLLDHA